MVGFIITLIIILFIILFVLLFITSIITKDLKFAVVSAMPIVYMIVLFINR